MTEHGRKFEDGLGYEVQQRRRRHVIWYGTAVLIAMVLIAILQILR